MKIVVVGASSGLGRCIGVDRGRRGDQVALLARRHDRLVEAAEEAGPGAVAIQCDVTDEKSCRAAVEEAAGRLGGIDGLVYSTGVGPLSPVEELTAEVWRRAFDTNVIGASLVTAAALPHLKDASGTVAFMSSVSASLTAPWPGFAAYNVSKAALDKMVDSWRTEHPTVGFTRIVMGDSAGGEGHGATEFPTGWDMDYFLEMHNLWTTKGLLAGGLLDVSELLAVMDMVLTSKATIPSVTLIPRPPG